MSDEMPNLFNDPNVEIGVGFSDAALLTVSLIGLIILIVTIYGIVVVRLKNAKEIDKDDAARGDARTYEEHLARQTDVTSLTRAERRARARAIMKQQRRVTPAPTAAAAPGVEHAREDEVDHEEEEEEDDNDVGSTAPAAPPALSRKERQKAAKAMEREERKRNEEERKRQQQEAQETARREKKLREEKEARRLEEERKLAKEQRESREREEQIKRSIFLSSCQRTQAVDEWIDELKQNRFVSIKAVSESFGVSQSAVVERIYQLMQERRVAGVFENDNGSFIYFSDVELLSLASKIQELGKVSLADVASLCNSRISA